MIVNMFLKLNYYMRIFDGLGFLVHMVNEVLKYLRYFLLYFFIFVMIGAMFFVIVLDEVEDYGLG